MATSPERIRAALLAVTGAAVADIESVLKSGGTTAQRRAALFIAAPLIVSNYSDGSSALALEWYEQQRNEARVAEPFTPTQIRLVTDEDVRAMVAESTEAMIEPEVKIVDEPAALKLLAGGIQKQVASGFWDTMTGNSSADPSAVGWRRYARAGACKFCVMIAGRGSAFTESTANFAAHRACHCLAGPSFDPRAPRATALQYIASKRSRTPDESAKLRAYLNENYPDSPG